MVESITIRKAFKFKLDATHAQEQQFRQYSGSVRWVYNRMLAQRNEAFQSGLKPPTTNEQIKQLPVLKQQEETAWLNTIHSQVLQDAVLDLDDAFDRFFKKQCKKPRFKSKHGKRQSFTYPQGAKVDDDKVWLPKIGWVRFRRSHEIEGTIRRATISHKASGWYISFNCEVEIAVPQPAEITPENSIGIDLGSIDLVTTSLGDAIPNPRHYRKLEQKLKREQRRLSRKKLGSNNRLKQKQRVAHLHEQIANRRKDCLHKLSRRLVDENQAIFCEDLNVLGIAKGLGKSVGDAAWGEFLRQLEYKSEWAGKTFLQIGRYFPSSKLCSECGCKHAELERSARTWVCPSCGVVHDRDVNAAVNIHREGLAILTAGHAARINACGEPVRPAKRARLGEARISRLEAGKCQSKESCYTGRRQAGDV
jgi:putative transposase